MSEMRVPMNWLLRLHHTWIVVDPMLLRSHPYSGRAGTVACVQKRSDECLGKPSVRPKQGAEVDRVLEPRVLPKREPEVVPM